MSDVPQERTDLPQEPYRPFPSFAEFAAVEADLSTVAEFVAILEEAKARATPERLEEAVRRATKWAAVDTGAIEGLYDVDRGFTITVAKSAAAWDTMQLEVGEEAARSINDALTAYDYVLDVVTDSRPITETWIKELHSVICASQETYKVQTPIGMQEQPLPRGVYKTQPNNPFNLRSQALHGYAPVTDTSAEMHRMVEELGSEEFATADPVLQAAYAHYAFVCIHPFADGNGRVARALASVYLYRSPGVPLVIFADQKGEYLDALEAADGSSYDAFVQFIADRSIDIVRMISTEARRPRQPTVERIHEAMAARLSGRDGLPHPEVDALGARLLDRWSTSINRAMGNAGEQPFFDRMSLDRSPATYMAPEVPGYRLAPTQQTVILSAHVPHPVDIMTSWTYLVYIAKGRAAKADFIIVTGSNIIEEALLRDLRAGGSQSLEFRLDATAEYEFLRFLNTVNVAAEVRLRERGYED